ncbi:hypothetical protein [Streptomyces sp. NPDC001153]
MTKPRSSAQPPNLIVAVDVPVRTIPERENEPLYEDAPVDAGVWIGAAAGLAGALVGAGGSIATTLVTQRHQKAEARREERVKLARETVDAITQELIALRELAWTYPAADASEGTMRHFGSAARSGDI